MGLSNSVVFKINYGWHNLDMLRTGCVRVIRNISVSRRNKRGTLHHPIDLSPKQPADWRKPVAFIAVKHRIIIVTHDRH